MSMLLTERLLNCFTAKKKPILGVCGGMQELNVYFGGTLERGIPNHRKVEHEVIFSPNSFLEKIYSCRRIQANSFHSQAVDKIASSLWVAATASDGTIEAVQSEDELILGVQWHPETDFAQTESDTVISGKKIFEYFLNKCATT